MIPQFLVDFGNGRGITMYGICIAVGMLACFLVLFSYSKRVGISNKYVDFAFYTAIVAIVIGFIGAALWQGTFNYIDDMKSYKEAIANGLAAKKPKFSLENGITAIGGLVTGALVYILSAVLFRKKYPFALTKTVTIAPCCMVIAHAFGRIGCFCAGCCYGKEATGFWSFLGVVFKGGSGAGVLRYPTQLFESAFLFILFGVMSLLVLKKDFKYNIVVYLAAYGIWRFFIEFLRDDPRGSFIPGLSPSQMQSIVLVLLAIPAFFLLRHYLKKLEVYENNLEAQAVGAISTDEVVEADEVLNVQVSNVESSDENALNASENESENLNNGENTAIESEENHSENKENKNVKRKISLKKKQ